MGQENCDSEQVERSSGSTEESPRSSCGSEDIMIHDRTSQPVTLLEHIAGNVNVTKCSDVQIGPQFRTVTQNIENINVDKDLPCHRFIWDEVKNSTRLERLSCIVATFILITSIVLIVYYTVIYKNVEKEKDDNETPDWYIDRRKWGATNHTHSRTKDHTRLVIIAHTADQACTTYIDCAAVVKHLQQYFLNKYNYDIPYNFLIGGDGRVYEGRGWNIVGAHTRGYNSCSLGIGFIGDYRYTNVTDLQQERVRMLFENGVKNGNLHSNFHVLGHLDLTATVSPGENLYNVIKTWPNYDHNNLYQSLSCQEIDDLQ